MLAVILAGVAMWVLGRGHLMQRLQGMRRRLGRTFRRSGPKIGRNAPCPCGSGKKWKRCCLLKKARMADKIAEITSKHSKAVKASKAGEGGKGRADDKQRPDTRPRP